MEAHLAPIQPTQVNKVTTSYEIYSGPHDTQYCMEDPEQAFIKYASSRTNEAVGRISPFLEGQGKLQCRGFDDGVFLIWKNLDRSSMDLGYLEKKRSSLRPTPTIAQYFLTMDMRRCNRYNVTPSPRRSRRRHKIP
ncbi:hypothetical protein Tco_0366560 [Tanacetum coccineum]